MSLHNLLLDRLPRDVSTRIRSDLRLVRLPHGKVLHYAGETIEQLYFPITCMISITVQMGNGQTVETAAVGRNGVSGVSAFMGERETTHTEYLVQVPGDAMVIAAAPLKDEFNRNTEMRDLMLKYTQALIAQISQNAACNRLHEIEQRCVRWLLEVRDHVGTDEIALTHEFLSQMLAVRRPGVTTTLGKLKEKKVIDQTRGNISIIDAKALEAMSCECYRVLKEEYDRILPPGAEISE